MRTRKLFKKYSVAIALTCLMSAIAFARPSSFQNEHMNLLNQFKTDIQKTVANIAGNKKPAFDFKKNIVAVNAVLTAYKKLGLSKLQKISKTPREDVFLDFYGQGLSAIQFTEQNLTEKGCVELKQKISRKIDPRPEFGIGGKTKIEFDESVESTPQTDAVRDLFSLITAVCDNFTKKTARSR